MKYTALGESLMAKILEANLVTNIALSFAPLPCTIFTTQLLPQATSSI